MFRETSVRFDFTKLASLEKVTAHIYCLYATPREVSRVEAALRRAVDVHPNNVILEMERFGEEEMDFSFTGEKEEVNGHLVNSFVRIILTTHHGGLIDYGHNTT